MQQNPVYINVVNELRNYFKERINTLTQAGIHDIVLDPGFGFGKNISHNYQLLNNLSLFKSLNCPLLVGLSRKSMIYKPLQITPNDALNGTTALHMHALEQGADILRVHDVREAMQCIQLHQLLSSSN
jgi:dihydropteroate synthase